jgi:hypothetical protein
MRIKLTEADKQFSLALRARYPICQMCYKQPATQLCHIKGRRTHATRYSVTNALSGCFTCHQWMGENPLDFNDWLEYQHPGRKDRIYLLAQGYFKNNAFNRKLVAKHYREQHKLILANPDHPLESWN